MFVPCASRDLIVMFTAICKLVKPKLMPCLPCPPTSCGRGRGRGSNSRRRIDSRGHHAAGGNCLKLKRKHGIINARGHRPWAGCRRERR